MDKRKVLEIFRNFAIEDGMLFYRGQDWNVLDLDEAFAISLVKWRILIEVQVNDGQGDSCGLCLYTGNHSHSANQVVNCEPCPIQHHTGVAGCLKTPYGGYHNDGYSQDAAEREYEFIDLVALENDISISGMVEEVFELEEVEEQIELWKKST